MSVIIKGMEMPKGCITCPCMSFGRDDCTMWCKWLDEPLGEWSNRGGKWRYPDCPLVPVPTPHGRLIDANALYEKTAEWEAQALHMVEQTMNDEDRSEWRKWSSVLTERSAFKYDVADALTIIEAEEGEEV